jgi:hypothetical protein
LSVFSRETVCFVLSALQSGNFAAIFSPFAGHEPRPVCTETFKSGVKLRGESYFAPPRSAKRVAEGAARYIAGRRSAAFNRRKNIARRFVSKEVND